MHIVKEGAANKSYGLQVALLAGVPDNMSPREALDMIYELKGDLNMIKGLKD